jgi:hypothetical protein
LELGGLAAVPKRRLNHSASLAVARKLAVIMHAMLKSGELFDRKIVAPA